MFYDLFASSDRKANDSREINSIFDKYGANAIKILRHRSKDRSLSLRDRKHWRRLLRLARSSRH